MRNRKVFLIGVVSILLFVLIGSIVAQDNGGSIGNYVNMRMGPSTNDRVISNLAPGIDVTVQAQNPTRDWLMVQLPDGTRGWVFWTYVVLNDDTIFARLPLSEERLNPVGGGDAPAPEAAAPLPDAAAPEAPAAPVSEPGEGVGIGTTIDTLNVRVSPGSAVINQIGGGKVIVIEGKNRNGDWILMHSPDNVIRGWISARYVELGDGLTFEGLPITAAQVSAAPVAPTGEDAGSAVAPEAAAPTDPNTVTGVMLGQVNVRRAPGVEHEIVGQLESSAPVVVEFKNPLGTWLLIHTTDGTTRGWVSAEWLRFTSGSYLNLHPTTQSIDEGLNADGTPQINIPQEEYDALRARLLETPILHNMNSAGARRIYALGRELGNNRNVFMLVGDSITATQPFMTGFGNGNYNLGGYGHLQSVIDFFSAQPAGTSPNSFVRESLAAREGFTSGAVLDGLWVDPTVCDEAPLYCEYNYIRPSVAVVLFGSVDMQISDTFTFQAHIYQITGDLVNRGVVPILTTFANGDQFRPDQAAVFNNVILNVARDYDVPVINLWLAAQALPNQGVKLDDPIHLTQGQTYYSFTGEETQFGVTLRNLLTLQALDEVRKSILTY